MTKKTVGWNSSYFGEAKPGSLKDVINGITSKQNALVGDKPHVADPITPEQVAAKEKFTKEERYTVSIETNKNDKSDDGEGLDAVQPKAVKKKFADRKDKDIDNDGDVDSSDKFLHKRRKAVSKAMAKEKHSKDHDEDEKEEGNAFGKALQAAKEKGDKTFVVSGKKYDVKTKKEMKHDGEEKPIKANKEKNGKNGVEVHGESTDWERVREFKVSSMKQALAQVYGEALTDDDKETIKPIIKDLKKSVKAHDKQAKQLTKDIKD
jgi:hypothetical protein